jgi:hypothetical protein
MNTKKWTAKQWTEWMKNDESELKRKAFQFPEMVSDGYFVLLPRLEILVTKMGMRYGHEYKG